jgi:hypothetical protein
VRRARAAPATLSCCRLLSRSRLVFGSRKLPARPRCFDDALDRDVLLSILFQSLPSARPRHRVQPQIRVKVAAGERVEICSRRRVVVESPPCGCRRVRFRRLQFSRAKPGEPYPRESPPIAAKRRGSCPVSPTLAVSLRGPLVDEANGLSTLRVEQASGCHYSLTRGGNRCEMTDAIVAASAVGEETLPVVSESP